jgi:hypothetical protein
MEILNKQVTSKDTKSVTKNLLTQKSLGQDGFTGKFHQIFKEELI